jgi:uncharacterized protein
MRAALNPRILVVALVVALGFGGSARAQTFPALTGRVVDAAQVLGPSARGELAAKLGEFEARTSHQLVIATVPALNGHSVEDYANRLFRGWGLGARDKNDGVLLLVAPAERKVRIEVGYGLEGTLTDAVAKLIIEHSIVPRFRAGDFAGGITQATDDIVQVLTGDAPAWQRRASAPAPQAQPAPEAGTQLVSWGDKLAIGIFLLFFAAIAAMFGFLFLIVLAALLVGLGVLPRQKDRHGAWLWLNYLNQDPEPDRLPLRAHSRRSSRASDSSWSSSSSSDSSSSSSDSFSGGGGSSGGGGASGSW